MYEVILSRSAAKFIESLDKAYRIKIKKIIEVMRENPFAYPYKKIRWEHNLYRIRIGKYRILYEIDKTEGKIIIIKIDKKSRIYER